MKVASFCLSAEKRQEEKKDTFMEKLATQVIKNLQVKISSIHLRYEDDVSRGGARPTMTLKDLRMKAREARDLFCAAAVRPPAARVRGTHPV